MLPSGYESRGSTARLHTTDTTTAFVRSVVRACGDSDSEVIAEGVGHHWYRVVREEEGYVTVSTCGRAGSGTRLYVIASSRCS